MHRDHHKWFSRSLNRDMELLVFGHAGPPMIVFPTSMGAFFEYEDRGMIDALADKLEHGAAAAVLPVVGRQRELVLQADPSAPPRRAPPALRGLRAERSGAARFSHLTRHATIGVTGCSFGAYHAMALALRHPYTFTSCVTMGGAFDISQFLDGYFDEDCYFLNPPSFLPNLADALLPRSVPPQQMGAGHRRPRHLPRAERAVLRRCCTPRASRTACTSGTTRSTTGRTGGRWPQAICPESGTGELR